MGLVGLLVGGFILFCLGRSSMPAQPQDIAAPDPASAKPDANQPQPPLLQSAETISQVRARVFDVTGVRPTAAQLPTSVAKAAPNVAYSSLMLFTTRRMQGFS